MLYYFIVFLQKDFDLFVLIQLCQSFYLSLTHLKHAIGGFQRVSMGKNILTHFNAF
jgi:hypothetical protein